MMCLVALVGLMATAELELEPAGAAKVFEGQTGEKITVVFLAPKDQNHVLIAFDGVEGEWDGRVIAHDRVVWGDKEDYKVDGKYVSLVQRYGRYEAYPKGAPKPLDVYYSKAESAKADSAAIVARFKASQAAKEKQP